MPWKLERNIGSKIQELTCTFLHDISDTIGVDVVHPDSGAFQINGYLCDSLWVHGDGAIVVKPDPSLCNQVSNEPVMSLSDRDLCPVLPCAP
jgi:hypothetical protein